MKDSEKKVTNSLPLTGKGCPKGRKGAVGRGERPFFSLFKYSTPPHQLYRHEGHSGWPREHYLQRVYGRYSFGEY